jgi:voltage-gated potassium channel
MLFLRQACAAIVLVMLTLGMQSAGMAGLIEWAKSHFAKGAQAFGLLGSAVLQPVWRLLGPVESIAGVLMCGLSASFLFAVVTRLIESSESAKSHR